MPANTQRAATLPLDAQVGSQEVRRLLHRLDDVVDLGRPVRGGSPGAAERAA